MTTTITPLGENVLIKMQAPETQTAAGIFIPETATSEKSQQGVIEAVGADVNDVLKKGSVVLFKKYGGEEISIDATDYVVVKQEDIIAIIEG